MNNKKAKVEQILSLLKQANELAKSAAKEEAAQKRHGSAETFRYLSKDLERIISSDNGESGLEEVLRRIGGAQ